MKSKKVLGMVLSMALMATSMAGCGASSESASKSDAPQNASQKSTSENTAEKEQTTITFWHNYSAESKESKVLNETLIPRFEQEHPEFKVEAVSYSWEDLHNKILIGAKAKKLPDVARLDIAWVPEFQKLDVLVPLDQEMSDFQAINDEILPNAMSTAMINGNSYAVGLNANSKILFYNKEALEQAGLSVPKTLDELWEDAAKLSGKNAKGQQVWGLDEPALSGWNLLPYIWSNGGSITDKDCKKATGYLNGKETVEAVEHLADLYQKHSFTGFNSGDIPMTDGFGTGRYAMLLEGPWKIAEMKGAYPDFQYGTAPMPAGKAGSISVLGGEDIGMFKDGNKEGAWEFIKFMTGEEAQVAMASCGQIPVNKRALENETVKQADFAPFLQAIATAQARPTVASWTEIDNQMTVTMTSIIKDGANAQESLDRLAADVDKLLQK